LKSPIPTAGTSRPLLVCCVTMLCAHGFAADSQYRLSLVHNGDAYTCTVTCRSSMGSKAIMQRLTDHGVIRQLSNHANSIRLITIDSTRLLMKTTFGYLGYQGQAAFQRQVFAENDSIAITMRSFEHNWRIIPSVRSIAAYYRIESAGDTSRVVYGQHVELSKRVGWIYMGLVRWQMKRFARSMAGIVDSPTKAAGK
jgi:hypothetical protein